MRTLLGIQASAGQTETLHRAPMDEVFGNDLFHILELHKAIPDPLRIDHHNRAMLALVEAAGLVGADEVLEARVLNGVLEGGFDLLAALGKTAWA